MTLPTINNLPFPTLRTARLQLRAIDLHDADTLLAIYSDAATMRWYGVDPLTEKSQVEQLIASFHTLRDSGNGLRWGIECDGKLIGTAGFFRWNKSWHNCMLGYELAHAAQAQGYMQEALRALIEFGFKDMQLHRVHAEIAAINTPSVNLIKRLGFRFEGVHREMGFWGGRWHDLDYYSLLEQEWPQAII
ncbi:MAG: GNAT family protein [Pseudomonadota bacterium]